MSTLANQIESYLKKLISEQNGVVELKRGDLAGVFMCVPSQINYVLETRFTAQHGYIVESRRGGGGYIRIVRLSVDEPMLAGLLKNKDRRVTKQDGELLIRRLVEEELLTGREGMLILALLSRELLERFTPDSESLRGAMLNTLLINLSREDFS
ncbi:MAG: CtsR family transcriptional regulator [Clostridiales bacterium]|nr:CtsR family transcriptional regulator [Clostridiales bacterium]